MDITETQKFLARSYAASKLIDRLRQGKLGDILTDDELTQVSGLPTRPGEKGYGPLMTAIRYVTRNHGLVWHRVRNEQRIECLTPPKILSVAKDTQNHIRVISKRTIQKIRTVVMDDVSEAERPQYLSSLAQFGTLAMFATEKARKRIEDKNATVPDMKKLLDAMK